MAEREQGVNFQISDALLETTTIDAFKRGLIGAYLQSKKEAIRQSNIARMLKDAIIDRVDDIVGEYSGFLNEEFANGILVPHTHARVKYGHNHGKPRRISESHDQTLTSPDGKRRRIKYVKTSSGKTMEAEGVRIEDLDSLTLNYIYINFISKKLEMRNNASHQTLLHGEPHIDSMSGAREFEEHADILDTFDDEIKLLRESRIL